MNPFDWSGPAFLVFYAAFAALSLVALSRVRAALEAGDVPHLPSIDPYLIAALREDRTEAIRVALVALVDRGLLERTGTSVVAAGRNASSAAHRPVEIAILKGARELTPVEGLLRDKTILAACNPLDSELRRLELIPDEARFRTRRVLLAVTVLLLWGIAGTKVYLALGRGHRNVGFLLVLAIAAAVAAGVLLARRRTTIGDNLLADLRTLLQGLRSRAADIEQGGATNELSLLVGVFGLSSLAGLHALEARALFPVKEAASSESSCSSSSCGSSCGGGGCGGGGCGGCGS